MSFTEDSDIKIFGKNTDSNENEQFLSLVEESAKQRANGNFLRAVKLGEGVAKITLDIQNIENDDVKNLIAPYADNEKILRQIKLLFAFSAEATFHSAISSNSLSSTAINSMYDTFISDNRDFYEETTDAFTFYYIAVRKSNNTIQRIGKRFAMVCSDSENDELKNLGSELYVLFCKIITEYVTATNFKED